MNNRTGYGLRIVLGGYLAYLGIRILIQTVNERPANMMFMGAIAVLFTMAGIAYAVYSVKKVWELKKAEKEPGPESEPAADEEKVEQSAPDGPAEIPEETQETEEIENDYEEK